MWCCGMIKVGCCGYPVSQTRYHETFNLVELNSTFYRYPSISTAERWRKKSPSGFEFTVKAHQDISHKYRLRVEQAAEPFERIKQICRVLEAKIILIQTPGSFTTKNLNDAERFFREVNRDGFILVWETRGPSWESEDGFRALKSVLSELNVTHVTDPLKMRPAYVSSVAYFRLHGLGDRLYYYQYTNEELIKIYSVAREFEGIDGGVYVLFNNLSMFDDAKRFRHLLEKGFLPPLTGAYGLEAVKAIIGAIRYPVTKSSLIDKVGWRLVEIEPEKQVRLSMLLKDIPEKMYNGPDEVLKELKALI